MAVAALVSVVDDDISVRESVPELLRQVGYEVRAFASAEEFLASGCLSRTGCLILDVAMPGMSGLQLQNELARRGQSVPIVFITAQEEQALRQPRIGSGPVRWLFKPFGDTALLEAVTAVSGMD